MRERIYLASFLLIAGFLIYLGHDLIKGSFLLSFGLTFGGTMAVAILALTLYRFRLELARSRHTLARREVELDFARQVQKALFPRDLPAGSGLEFAAVCIPASGISGDYYDVMQLPDGSVGFAIADISGKGISAAILMANLQATLRVTASSGDSPARLCGRMNRHLHQVTDATRFATLFYGQWEPGEGCLRYVNAGHNNPHVIGPSKKQALHHGGIPLGIIPEFEYEAGAISMQPGELLVLYSDGITEAGARDGAEFGEPRLLNLITTHYREPLTYIQDRILEAVRDWAGEEVEDDMTLMLVRAVERTSSGSESQ